MNARDGAMRRIGILGAGAWGTALAMLARRVGRETVLWAHEPEVVEAIESRHQNSLYLPGVALDPAIRATADMAAALEADAVLLAVPTQHLRAVLRRAAVDWPAGVPAVICAKGVEIATGALPSEVVGAELPQAPLAVLSGPTFAGEVARDLPTAVTLACADGRLGGRLASALGTGRFRIYGSTDVIGAQVGGAVKNVLAIACGIVEGRQLGENTRAALIARGLAEICRLGLAMGAEAQTFMGLSGIGDLVLTCNAMQSRNFSLGVALGQGRPLAAVLGERRSVAEGVYSAGPAVVLAHRHGVEMPIVAAVDAVLNRGAGIEDAIAGLLARPVGAEAAA